MTKKPKLSQEKNLQLKGLTLKEKLNLLHKWKKDGSIDLTDYNYFSRLWIEKESKKLRSTTALRKTPNENRDHRCPRLAVEGEIQTLLEKIRRYSKDYFSRGNGYSIELAPKEFEKFKTYVEKHFVRYPDKIYRLLIEGLRFPDKSNTLSTYCIQWIKDCPIDYYLEKHFWFLLWEEGSFVPMDAIRLMLDKKGENYQINPRFEKNLIKGLLPKFYVHRDMEIERLENAQKLEGIEREREVNRKIRRLEAFNLLISTAENFCD